METPLPSSESAEKGLLSSWLLSPEKVYNLCLEQNVSPDWFYNPIHKTIYNGLVAQKKAGVETNFILLGQYLKDEGDLEGIGGEAYLTELFTYSPTASNAKDYLAILRDKLALRTAIFECDAVKERIQQECSSTQEVHDACTGCFQKTLEICVVEERGNVDQDEILAFMDKMEKACMKEGNSGLMPFGLPSMDNESGGAQRGELVVVQGQTSTFKSVLSKKFTQHAAFDRNERVAVFSLEMLHEQCLRRYCADIGSISLQSMRHGKFTKQEFKSFSDTMVRISNAPLHIYDVKRNAMTPQSIEAEVRRLKKNKGLDMMMCDYLQLLRLRFQQHIQTA